MKSIKLKKLAKYCNSVSIDCEVCKMTDACEAFDEKIKDISPMGVVEIVESNAEIWFDER